MTGQKIHIGKISGVFGIKGWLKVFSYTEPRKNILDYSPWIIQQGKSFRKLNVIEGKRQGKAIIARIEGVCSRDEAEPLCGLDIFIERAQLPATDKNEYYWMDLVGLSVETKQGIFLGVVDHLLRTGANDVLVLSGDRERLVPFLQGQTVLQIDLQNGLMIVDWDPDF